MFFKEKKPAPLTLFIHKVRGDFVHGEFNRTVAIQEVLDVLYEFREMVLNLIILSLGTMSSLISKIMMVVEGQLERKNGSTGN